MDASAPTLKSARSTDAAGTAGPRFALGRPAGPGRARMAPTPSPLPTPIRMLTTSCTGASRRAWSARAASWSRTGGVAPARSRPGHRRALRNGYPVPRRR